MPQVEARQGADGDLLEAVSVSARQGMGINLLKVSQSARDKASIRLKSGVYKRVHEHFETDAQRRIARSEAASINKKAARRLPLNLRTRR